ncbi:ABC transporter substrate-binding protein [Variovorax sp. PBL-E5]|uniref:ABC transporter substrate-binding protein n=1 Tax=Variovorax sp. PBL-E5 TaxID=434014 RepID=UPI0013185203|nr:ABC transporter substrate-binding protein [Variovorax sp. PBL-E5]VTU45632.1 ABC transporter, substrate-binding protein, aliphatic sulfonates family [Variovorax sp. PBL-E5]
MTTVRRFAKVLVHSLLGIAVWSSVSATALAAEQVNVRFSWKLKGEYAALYVAKEKAYFAREGLEVRLGEGAGAPAALGGLLQGQEDLVLLPGVFALTAISKGMPIKIVALYHPRTPVALISWPEKPVRVPKDLEGKSIATSIGETGTTYLDSFCKKNRIDCDKVKRVQVNAQTRVTQFIQHQVDVVSVYQTNDLPIIEEKEGTKFVVLEMDKHGLDVPGMALVSSDAIIAKKPEVLRKFLKAVGEGVSEMKKNTPEAAEMMMKNWPGHPSATAVAAQVKATAAAIPMSKGHPVGWTDDKVIVDALAMLKETGEIEAPKPSAAYFTNDLLGGK